MEATDRSTSDNHLAVAEKGSRRVDLVPLLEPRPAPAPAAAALDQRVARLARRPGGLRHARLATPRRTEIIEALAERSTCCRPSSSSSAATACDDAVRSAWTTGCGSPPPRSGPRSASRCDERTEGLPDDELRVLGYGPWMAGLEAGVAPHHAGMIPAFREAVEECFTAGLLQVVFATETLRSGSTCRPGRWSSSG